MRPKQYTQVFSYQVSRKKKKTQKLPKHACCLSQKMNTNFKLDIKKSSYVVSAANFMKILLMFVDCITSTQVY